METAMELLTQLWPVAVIIVALLVTLIITREKKEKGA